MENKPENKTYAPVINFLFGGSDLDGYWYGDHPKGRPHWWREHLRKYVESYVLSLEYENKDLQDKLKESEHLKELADDAYVNLKKEVDLLKERNSKLAQQQLQDMKELFTLKNEIDTLKSGKIDV